MPVDADLVLRVDRWLGFAVDVRDAQIALHADERGLRAPISGTIAGVPLSGRIDLETAAPTPALALEADGEKRAVARSRGSRSLPPAVLDGNLGSVALRAGARGETLGALVDDLELRLAVTGDAAALRRLGGAPPGRSHPRRARRSDPAWAAGARHGARAGCSAHARSSRCARPLATHAARADDADRR